MRTLFRKALVVTAALSVTVACGKKEKDDSDDDDTASISGTGGGGTKSTENVPASLAAPKGVLTNTLASMSSVMAVAGPKMTGGAALLLDDSEGFTEADCTEHADAKARAGDGADYTDNSGRLRIEHPRAALQQFYCQMQKDTGAPDSFIGALSQSKLLFCFMGEGLVFDGVARDVQITEAIVDACGISAADKKDMFGEPFQAFTVNITASRPGAFGDAAWDGSVLLKATLGDETIELKSLLKDSDGILAVASAGGGNSTDAYVAAVNTATGEVRYEAKFQRMRTLDGTNSNGWNRHARAYVKGTMGADYKFSDVSSVQGAYSDISLEAGGTIADKLQSGTLWTVSGTLGTGGIRSHAYQLSCSGTTQGQPYTCGDANLVASWAAVTGDNACNGSATDTSCTGDGVKLTTDAETQFVMEGSHASFQKSEDWFATLAVPAFTSVSLDITQ